MLDRTDASTDASTLPLLTTVLFLRLADSVTLVLPTALIIAVCFALAHTHALALVLIRAVAVAVADAVAVAVDVDVALELGGDDEAE